MIIKETNSVLSLFTHLTKHTQTILKLDTFVQKSVPTHCQKTTKKSPKGRLCDFLEDFQYVFVYVLEVNNQHA